HDLRAVGATVHIAEQHGKPLVFVINDAPRARITSQTAVALSQHGTVAPVTILSRVDYAASMVDGRTAGEVDPGSKAAEEINQLWKYVADRLSRTQPQALAPTVESLPEITELTPAVLPPERPHLVWDDPVEVELQVLPPEMDVAQRARDAILGELPRAT